MESLGQSAQDLPILSFCAGALHLDGRIRAARVVWCGSNTAPRRLHAVEAVLSGAEVNLALLEQSQQTLTTEARMEADSRSGVAYREHLSRVLLGRVLRRILAATATGI